jgi:hypothetical protein
MRLRRHYADPRRYREAELAEMSAWLTAHPITRCRPACVAPIVFLWPRKVEAERMSAVALKVCEQDERKLAEWHRKHPHQFWWRAPAPAADAGREFITGLHVPGPRHASRWR